MKGATTGGECDDYTTGWPPALAPSPDQTNIPGSIVMPQTPYDTPYLVGLSSSL